MSGERSGEGMGHQRSLPGVVERIAAVEPQFLQSRPEWPESTPLPLRLPDPPPATNHVCNLPPRAAVQPGRIAFLSCVRLFLFVLSEHEPCAVAEAVSCVQQPQGCVTRGRQNVLCNSGCPRAIRG